MVGMSGSAPNERPPIPGATLSLIAVAFSELRRDLRQLLDSNWDEPVRRRAEELSQALALVCQRRGLDTLRTLLRSTGHLARLSRSDAIPLLPALREKFESLMREIELGLPKRSDRFGG
ncbi:MAG TPA: hypothetical protein VKU80_14160 [Planctomycetota bacterium]|nr:hypothetical protein [Planctomycetota bacterium]